MMPPNLPDSSYLYGERWDRLPPDGYYLSSRGRIWNDAAKRFVRPSNVRSRPNPPILFISINKKKRYLAPLARTVLTMFGSPSPGGRSYVCRHKDGDPLNNQIENLDWIKCGTCTSAPGVSNAKFTSIDGGRSWSTLYDLADGPIASRLQFGGEDVTKPVIAIGSGTTENGNKTYGEFHAQWREGYLESLPEGPVELASTVSAGVEYRFSVCRVGDVADKLEE